MPAFDHMSQLRPAIRQLSGYEPVEPAEEIATRYGIDPLKIAKLDGNENPYGPSPRALRAIAEQDQPHRYPDPDQRRLRAALGRHLGVPAECIVAGAGADELIDLVFRAYVDPGDRVVIASPTFGMYRFDAGIQGATCLDVPREEPGWSLDVSGLEEAARGAKAIFVPSPNNPTGDLLPKEARARLMATGALLVIDEAYIEFSDAVSAAPDAADGAPLIVLRTFSKWGGLAGLRVGYGVMPSQVASTFMQIKQPYGVNVAAEAAALESLEDAALLDERAMLIVAERERLAACLEATEWLRTAPSAGNFILCRIAGPPDLTGVALRDALRRRGVFVRTFGDPRLEHHIRISIGRPEDSERLLEALEAAGAELGANG